MKKILSILLLITITISVFIFISCSQENKGNDMPTSDSPDEQEILNEPNEEETIDEEEFDPGLPEQDFEGYEFRVLNINQSSMNWAIITFDTEEETGDPVNDAIYRRNRNIESKYNFKLKETNVDAGQISNILRSSAKAGLDDYDVAFPVTYELPGLISGGVFADLNNVPHIDFNQPWWNTWTQQYFTINNKTFFMTSDLLLTDDEDTIVLMYNMNLANMFGIESAEQLYAVVNEGKWTMDKFEQLCKAGNKDVNGDGEMKGDEDRFGLVCIDWIYTSLVVGYGETMTKRDDGGLPVIAANSQRYSTAFERMVNFVSQRDTVIRQGIDTSQSSSDVFMDERALFCCEVLSLVRICRDLKSDFAVLPMPKLNEEQAKYYTPVQWSTCVTIPLNNPNLERTGFILEALTAESRKLVRPAYYDVSIGLKYLRDEGSVSMLDIILDNQTYDELLDIYNWGSFNNIFSGAVKKGDTNFVSLLEKNEPKIIKDIDKTVKLYVETE